MGKVIQIFLLAFVIALVFLSVLVNSGIVLINESVLNQLGFAQDQESAGWKKLVDASPELLSDAVISFQKDAAEGSTSFAILLVADENSHTNLAALYDANGKVIHAWGTDDERQRWLMGILLKDQSIIVVDKDTAIRKFDKNSNLLATAYGRFHRDVRPVPSGGFYTLTQEVAPVRNPVSDEFCQVIGNSIQLYSDDFVLMSNFALIGEVSDLIDEDKIKAACEVQEGSGLDSTKVFVTRDIAHANSVAMIERDIAGVAVKGDFLVSFKFPSVLAVFDGATGKRKWHVKDLTEHQYGVSVSSDDTFLVFDNRESQGRSRVVEIDPRTKRVIWEFDGAQQFPFFSAYGGSFVELPGGNLFASIGWTGQGFEVTRGKEIVWAFGLDPVRDDFPRRRYFNRLMRY